jgi:hypothetical protein
MLFMNEYEIEDSLLRFGSEETPNLLKGAKVLDGLRRWANSNSDGWAYWQKPLLAAKKLMTLLQAADRFDPTDCTDAELRAALTPIKSFLTKQGVEHHDKVELVYISQGEELSDKQIQTAFAGTPSWENGDFDEYESEARHAGLWSTLEYHVDHEDLDLIRADQSRFEELQLAVEERDESDPFMTLARMTPHKWMRYVANWDAEPWPYDNLTDDIAGIAAQLGIDREAHDKLLQDLVTEANGGGVYVLWYGDVEELIVAAQNCDHEGKQVPQTITWENPHLLVLDCMSGSGHMVDFPGTITLPFDRARLMLDARNVGNGYSWSDDVAGLAGDRGTTTVTITQNGDDK